MDIVGWLRSRAEMARRGARLVQSTGVLRGLGPLNAVKIVRDVVLGRRGAMAVIHYHATVNPERPAIVFGDARHSYGELEQRVHQLTHVLAGLGMKPGDRIGVFLHNHPAFLELAAALPAIGGVAVQIGYRLKAAEVQYLMANSGAKALLFSADLAPVVEEALPNLPGLPRPSCISIGAAAGFTEYESALASVDGNNPEILSGSGTSGVMLYTSGTTGKSKGAARDFKKMGFLPVVHFISSLPIQGHERHLVLCPLYHSAAPAIAALVMGFGGCIVIAPRFDAEEVLKTIERERITSTLMVPTMLNRVVALPPETLRRYDCSSLRWVLSGAAPLPTETAHKFEDAFGPVLFNFYGATETGFVAMALPGEHTARPGTIGRAVGGNEIRLLDAEGHEVPVGAVGELFVKNEMMMDGYHGNDEATRAVKRDGFISVGDLASRDADGYLFLADRKTDMVISGGVNIYPWEIEQRLHEHPGVADVAVVGAPDAEWGETLVAFVVRKPGASPTGDELAEFVKTTLADFKRPRHWFFIDELPRNATGKVLKREQNAGGDARRRWCVRMLGVLALLTAATATASAADSWARLGEGAPVYAVVRPGALLGALKRIGVGELPDVQALKAQIGGLDVLNPSILAPTGLDPDQPAAAALLEPAGKNATHHRIVAALKDPGVFKTLITSMAASGQMPLKAGAADAPASEPVATASGKSGTAVVRIDGDLLIIDAITVTTGKPPAAADVTKRFALTPQKPVLLSRGSRRVLVDATIGATLDGRKLATLIDSAMAIAAVADGSKPKPTSAACVAQWAKAPTVFDDVAVALAGTDEPRFQVAWGTQPGKLVPLKFKPVDDQGFDTAQLAETAAFTLTDFDASLTPLSSLPRSGPYVDDKTLGKSIDNCGPLAIANLLVRGWPTALAAAIGGATKQAQDPTAAAAVGLISRVRNATVAMRDMQGDEPRWVAGITMDGQAQPIVTTLLGLLGAGEGTPTPYGKRTPRVYAVGQDGDKVAAAVDTLANGVLSVALADSADTLAWAYRPVTRMPGSPPPLPPVGTPAVINFSADGGKFATMLPSFKLNKSDEKSMRAILSRVKRLDADLRVDGDMLRFTARVPLR